MFSAEDEAVHFSEEAVAMVENAKRLREVGPANFSAADHAKLLCVIIDEICATEYMRELLDRHLEEVTEIHRGIAEEVRGTFGKPSGNIRETFGKHSGNIVCILVNTS
jgi:hypothetical protein